MHYGQLQHLFEIPTQFVVDEEFYLDRYPDVKDAVAARNVKSAQEHFEKFGALEGRIPSEEYGEEFLRWLKATVFKSTVGNDLDIQKLAALEGIAFFQALDALPYWKSTIPHPDRSAFAKRLVALSSCLKDRERIFVFSWLLANHDHNEAVDLVADVSEITDGRILPSLFKAVDAYCIDTARMSGLRAHLFETLMASSEFRAFQTDQAERFADALVSAHAAEISSRYDRDSPFALANKTVAPSPKTENPHLFVGFFGQLRFPEETLKPLCNYIRSEFPNVKVSLGVSTWDKSGFREIVDEDPIGFAAEQLPVEFAQFINTRSLQKFWELAQVFPAIADYLRSRGSLTKDVDETQLKALCGGLVASSVDPDSTYMHCSGRVIAEAFPGQTHMLNQGRMWNRIARFRDLIASVEAASGPVSDVILMRSDIKISGCLSRVASRIIGAERDDLRVFVDFDAHARHLSGIGDRIFVAKRNTAMRLIDAERIMQNALLDGGRIKQLYYWFMSMHTYPQTLLYQQGCNLISMPLPECAVEIYRGRLRWEQFMGAASLDLSTNLDEGARQFLEGAIQNVLAEE